MDLYIINNNDNNEFRFSERARAAIPPNIFETAPVSSIPPCQFPQLPYVSPLIVIGTRATISDDDFPTDSPRRHFLFEIFRERAALLRERLKSETITGDRPNQRATNFLYRDFFIEYRNN